MARASWMCSMVVVSVAGVCAGESAAHATTDCRFVTTGRVVALQADCTTDATLSFADGVTLNGNLHTITAVDPPTGFFSGAVVTNAGRRLNVRALRITSRNLGTFCHAEPERLRAIWLNGASGEISRNTIVDFTQRNIGCQEGNGIVAENLAPGTTEAFIHDNVITGFEKLGVEVSGGVRAHVRDNTITGSGPADNIAQVGIRVGFGASGTVVSGNVISDNSYTGTQDAPGVGVQVVGGAAAAACPLPGPCPLTTDVQVNGNVIESCDVGVMLLQSDAGRTPPDDGTDIVVRGNRISNGAVTNARGTQVGIFDVVGNGERIVNNLIQGAGYDPFANAGRMILPIRADEPFAVGVVQRGNAFAP